MGKKSLIKSTSKKKKKAAAKKTAAKAKPMKKAPAKKAPAKKAAAKSKPAAKVKPAAKPVKKTAPKKSAPKKTAPKKAAPKKTVPKKKAALKAKPVSVKDLLKKQFATEAPKTLYSVPAKMVEKSTFTAPELVSGFSAGDAKRIQGLLANTYSAADLKAATEKAATEKAAAEKAAAEKAAAEKAAAEKAAAEKAAAEKAAAEKAAAEKAAAEKAAEIKKAAAQKSEVAVSYEPAAAPSAPPKPSDPVDNTIKIMAAGLAFLILLVVGASFSNSFKYYLKDNQGALEIWKGKFAPLGKKMVIALPGVPVPEDLKTEYTSGEVYPLAFQYYIDKADALLDVPGIPDFEGIKETLKVALEFGSSSSLRDVAYQRLDNIDRLILTYKADVAASRGTIQDLTAAIGFLQEADKLTKDPAVEERIARKIADHQAVIATLEEQAEAERAAAEAEAVRQAEEAAAIEAANEGAETAAEEQPEDSAKAEDH